MGPVLNLQDPVAQMNTYRSFVSMLVDPGAKDENKLKAAQELSENFETILTSSQYPTFLEHAMRIFLKILQDGEPQFCAEFNVQQLRKLILEMLHRIPTNEHLRIYSRQILSMMFKLLEVENEENVLVCLRIIIELHKQYRPPYNNEIQNFLNFVKNVYKELPNLVNKIFEPRSSIKVKDMSEVDIEALLAETFTTTSIQTEKKNLDGTTISYNLIPKGIQSLKVLAELPIIVVLIYQLYKQNVHQDVAEFVPLILNTIILQPLATHRTHAAFNKEIFVDFMAAQIKTLSFLAYIVRVYQETVTQHSSVLVKGMLGLLILCPQEVAHLRKELLIAARHILATDLRTKFVPYMENLLDENTLIGSGWTTYESLRPLAYSTLADLVHHVRQQLPLNDLAIAVNLFSKNIHDESLPTSIQTMSCKLLLNLVDCIRSRSEHDSINGRELLMQMLEVFVLKAKTIAKLQLPALIAKSRPHFPNTAATAVLNQMPQPSQSVQQSIFPSLTPVPPLTPVSAFPAASTVLPDVREEPKNSALSVGVGDYKDDKPKFGFPQSQISNYTIVDCRSLVKTLVCGAKTITWGIANCKAGTDMAVIQNKQFQPNETLVFIRLFKYAMQALDIYVLTPTPALQMRLPQIQSVRSKEEKDVLEHFSGVFTMMSPQTFKEIFSTMIEFMVERINKNYALQIITNSFLSNPAISPIFATILIEFLLGKMEEMGTSNTERSNLYLKLFKLVFGSVSLFAAENELMLKPHLHQIVNRSMDLAMSAKEPYNYYLLLRALFRSIGGGSHDQLYQEFLPLLPTLLQGLNSLQSGLHKQHMKDLFVELCLTVPVRLSSLLPYLPMLMDPLVSALNGSQTLVSQGLRTLELCVDNLQPDFLYEHIQPVRAELMQALWRTLHNPVDSNTQAAFRVLGKFGGGNRKMMAEPQALEHKDDSKVGPCLTVYFQDHKSPIALPVEKVIETAFNALKLSTTEPFYRRQSWEVIRCYLVASIQLDDEKQNMQQLFSHYSFAMAEISPTQSHFYKCPDVQARKVHEMALTSMFVAAAIKELRPTVFPIMASLVRHYTMVAISQQCGPFSMHAKQDKMQGMDPFVLVDAVATIMGHEEKELCKPGHLALVLILHTASCVLGSKERASQLPFLEYLVERMCSLCYDRAWYAKMGGCVAIKFLFERMDLKWVFQHQFVFLKAMLFVMMDLTGEVSNGAIDMAKSNLEKMLTLCGTPLEQTEENEDLIATQKKSLYDVIHELVRQITSPNTCVREQAMHSLQVLAKITNMSVTDIMLPHKDILADMIPPKKHCLKHQPANAQIGLMDGNTFCTSLKPRLFAIDLNILEHKLFYGEVLALCEAENAVLQKLPCFKSVTNLIPLRKSALRALAACHYVPSSKDRIFPVLYKALSSPNSELQEVGFECLQKLIASSPIEMEAVHTAIRPLLLQLGDYRSLTLNFIQRLSFLTQLFPNTFNERLCKQLLDHLRKWLEVVYLAISNKVVQRSISSETKTCIAIINIFHQIPAASHNVIDPLTTLVLRAEKALLQEAGSPFRVPLVKFLIRYPSQAIDFLFSDANLRDPHCNRFVEFLVRHPDGNPFRECFQTNPNKLINMLFGNITTQTSMLPKDIEAFKHDLTHLAVSIIHTLVKFDEKWLSRQPQLVAALKRLWISDEYQDRHRKVDSVSYVHWNEPKLLVKILLSFFCQNPSEIELLFQLLRPLTGRYIPDFQFLKDFLERTMSNSYSIDWKRMAFFKFVELFHDESFSHELKAKVLQYIIIPCFAISFERGEGEKLIGGPPAPDQDLSDNVISVFINKVIDPENPFGTSDAVRILLLQLSCLLVGQASPHIHDAANKRQGNKLRRLMTFAWPCLLGKSCVDPATKYHGHLLLAHIIAKFAIHKRIVLQVFHSLLKAHALEARNVVRQALEILTPSMPVRMEDGNTMLTHWTKKIIVEEGHMVAQLVHMLQLLVRHHKVYYPVRHHLIQHMVSSMQRLGFTPSSTIEQKKLAVDLSEVIIKWELQRIKEEDEFVNELPELPVAGTSQKRASPCELPDPKRARHSSGTSVKAIHFDSPKPVEKIHADAVVNFLLRIACQVNEATTTGGSPGEVLSRRCVALLKMALKPEVWQTADLRLAWFDKLLVTVETAQPNFSNICTALDLLAFLISFLRKDSILSNFKPLQRGIAACMTCPNSKVIRATHVLLSRLMAIFPTESLNSSVSSKYEELECLYTCVGKVVYEGLANYEKNVNASPSNLFGTLMILKAACTNNLCFIDRLITSFMRVLQRMAKEHLNPSTQEANPVASELLILSLDLVKNRVGVMGQDMRKTFIGSILVGLIEKTQDVKVMKAITKMVEEWVKLKSAVAINQSPSPREKSILLVKMMQFIEKRFPNELELNAQFLELVNYVYRDESLKGSELLSKLEPAFLAGLRCVQPQVRTKFFEVFDNSMKRRLHERLLYITCSQNWEAIGPYYWIKQCIELLMATTVNGLSIQSSSSSTLLPSITSVIGQADSSDRASFAMAADVKEEPMDVESVESNKEEDDLDLELTSVPADEVAPLKDSSNANRDSSSPKQNLHVLLTRQAKFLETIREVNTVTLLNAMVQLCHMDTKLAERVWLDFFPRCWKILSERQQQVLATEMTPFLCSGSHVIQKDCHPSAINTFTEGLSLCEPPLVFKPVVLRYIGKSYNLWHRSVLMMEHMVASETSAVSTLKARAPADCPESDPVICPEQEKMDTLSDMYSLLHEEDMWAGLWQRRAKYRETNDAIAFEQQGLFERAQSSYELAIMKARQDYNTNPAPPALQSEYKLWDSHWSRCCKELNQWDLLLEYGNTKGRGNPYLVLESAWRVPDWNLMKDSLTQVESNCPKEMAWKVNLYRGFVAICHPDEHHLSLVERLVEVASGLCIKEWRRLPHIVSHVHLPYLQAAQQIMELQEAAQINHGLLAANTGRQQNSLQDMKAIVKTWRNRLPVISDDLSHWSDIFAWRQHSYQLIINTYDSLGQQEPGNHSMLGVHASAQAIIHFGKIARKHNLPGVCWECLSRIHTIPSVPIVDCFQKIRQQVKCCLQMAGTTGKNELQEGLDVIESTNLKYFTKEMTAEFFAMKGTFLAQIGRSDEANKAFSAAVQLHDTLVKAWALWGDYLEQVFTRDRHINLGVSAITCFLHACRHQNEGKSRKYLAKVLWLLTYDDDKCSLAEAVEKYSVGVPALQWLPWIPQLLTCLVRNEGRLLMALLSQVGKIFPQAVYFPIRTLYLTLKFEQRERYKCGEVQQQVGDVRRTSQSSAQQGGQFATCPPSPLGSVAETPGGEDSQQSMIGQQQQQQQQPQPQQPQNQSSLSQPADTGSIKATTPMWRCSRIMHMQRELHPTVLMSLEGIVDQMVWFRESWYEEVLRQLRQCLSKCYVVAFESRADVMEATVTPHTVNFLKKLVSTFGVGYDNVPSNSSSASLARTQPTAQDPSFHKMKGNFSSEFEFNTPASLKLQNLIGKLKKWIKILEAKIKTLPKSFLIEEKCRFLSNFSAQTAEIELPGEFLLPKHNHYYVKIARFMPQVELIQKHGMAARRLYIRGHNGKVYPYLVVTDSCMAELRREERVLQLMRMLNHFLLKQKETARRFLSFTVPRVVAVAPATRLIEDNPHSISLLDIYKKCCEKSGIEHDAPIARFYERFAAVQARGSQASHQVLRDILKDVQSTMVPRDVFKKWAMESFPAATDYWTFRKMFTLQIALAGLAEFALHLTRLNPDMMYIHQDSGMVNIAYFRFDIDDVTGDLDSTRPVPFRLTPNIAELVTSVGIYGPLTASMIATARCFIHPSFKIQALLRAVLRDELLAWHKKKQDDTQLVASQNQDVDGEILIAIVNKTVATITGRLQHLATFEGAESKLSTLVAAANSHDNLCRMDPAWHPWL